MVLAGAGTGKTRVIAYRIAYLLSKGVAPENILAVTFTNKAAREMLKRVLDLLGVKRLRDGPTVVTFHRLGVLLLREEAERAGRRRNFTIYDRGDSASVVRELLAELSSTQEKPEVEAALDAISAAKTGFVQRLEDPFFERLFDLYEEALLGRNAFDLDDLIRWPVKLLQDRGLRRRWHERFRYVLVDEYQDTNGMQYEFLRHLVGPKRNVCVVGDDDQSIYRFRGAQREKILSFRRDFPGASVVALQQNYRSTNSILQAANAVIARSARRHPKKLYSNLGAGRPVRLITYEDQIAEAEGIVEEIKERHIVDNVPFEHTAVLLRSIHQARPFEERLRIRRVPYTLVGGSSWFDRKEVRDLLAYLRLLVNPRDEDAFLRVVNVPRRGVGPATVARIIKHARSRGASLAEVLENREKISGVQASVQNRLWSFGDVLRESRALAEAGRNVEAARRLIDGVGYREEIQRLYPDPQEAALRMQTVDDLLAALQRFSRSGVKRDLCSFIEDLTLEITTDRDSETKIRGVALMTIHSAKGLEFEIVYVAGVEEGILPHEKSIAEGDEAIEEERRLLYVAMTRAKRSLTLTLCEKRARRGASCECTPSRFLADIPPRYLSVEEPEDFSAPLSPEERARYIASLRARKKNQHN